MVPSCQSLDPSIIARAQNLYRGIALVGLCVLICHLSLEVATAVVESSPILSRLLATTIQAVEVRRIFVPIRWRVQRSGAVASTVAERPGAFFCRGHHTIREIPLVVLEGHPLADVIAFSQIEVVDATPTPGLCNLCEASSIFVQQEQLG